MIAAILRRIISILTTALIFFSIALFIWILLKNRGFIFYHILYLTGCIPFAIVIFSAGGSLKGRGNILYIYGSSTGVEDPEKVLFQDIFNKKTLSSNLNMVFSGLIMWITAALLEHLFFTL